MLRKPIDLIIDALLPKVRVDPSGAKSLAHVLAVVPTAQSGRRLRRVLAERLGAVVPPLVKTPRGMMLDEDDPALAGRTDEIAAFAEALGVSAEGLCVQEGADVLPLARQLSDIRAVLSAKALSFADVAAFVAREIPDEASRWDALAAVETRYLEALARRGRKDAVCAMKDFCPDRPGIEETVRFDDPAAFLPAGEPAGAAVSVSQIVPCATAADEAERIACFFAGVKDDEAWPALCVADPDMFTEIVSAMRAKGIEVHDPSETRLASSSLGHLVSQIVALKRTSSYAVFSAFIRGGDVRRWICAGLGMSDDDMTDVLIELDRRQADYLPSKIEDIAPKTRGPLRAVFEFVGTHLRKKDLRGVLASVFSGRVLDGRDAACREFAAAAEVVNRLVDECGDDVALLDLRLDESAYSLEPDEGVQILTDGWMELPFLEADELVIAGFVEGRVPESTVGHPFLPDSLRARLGLPDNASKEARDRAIFRLACASRGESSVKVFFHSVDSAGDALKPSRLLFETPDDADLVERVERFYRESAGSEESSPPDLPDGWKLSLPVPPESREITDLSPTRIDSYLSCPFTCYLRGKNVLGDKRMDDRAEELASWEYGNLAHDALERFGTSDIADCEDADEIAAFLRDCVDGRLEERFGASVPAIVAMQGESVKRRLTNFAAVQVRRRAEGWRIVAAERKLEVQYGHTRFHGKCDRVDFNASTGQWCVIDYKTWDTPSHAASFTVSKRSGLRTWNSVQLPLYCAMLDAHGGEFAQARLENIVSCYCVLGKTADDVLFTEAFSGAYVQEAEELVRALVKRMEAGIFWPPGKGDKWKFDYEDWLSPAPEMTVAPSWIADQQRRIADFSG